MYEVPVGGINTRELPKRMRRAITRLERDFKGLGIVLLVADYGASGGCAHVTNIDRPGLAGLLREYADIAEARDRKRQS